MCASHSLHRSCAILLLLWIVVDCYGLLTIMEYHGVLWTIVNDNGLWTMVDYNGVWTIMDYRRLMGLIMGYGLYGLLWTIVAQRGLSWIIVDSKKCTTMESRGLEDMRLRPLTTPRRYGAGMAHTVVSIGFIDYCRLSCTACRITVDY